MAAIGELAIFMWNVAGAPPNSTGAPGRMTCAIVMPARTSIVWKTVAPTVVTGAMRPISVTGTISTGTPASTQSIMFWHESSLYRKLPVAVIVKMLIGRAMRSARSDAEELHHLDHPRHAVLRERPRYDRLLRVGQRHVQAPRVGDLGLDVGVRREGGGQIGDVLEPIGETDVLDEVRRVGQADLARPVIEPLESRRSRHEVDAVAAEVGMRVAVPIEECERLRRGGDRALDDVAREEDALALMVEREPVIDQALPHLGAADLHPDLGQDSHRFVEDAPDQVIVEHRELGPHRSSTASRRPPRRHGA